MKGTKRYLVLLSCLFLITSLVSACSSTSNNANGNKPSESQPSGSQQNESASKNDGNKVSITFWNMFGGGDGAIMTEIVKKFNEEYKGKIEVKAMTQDWDQFYTKLQTAVAGGTAPDLAISHASKLSELVEAGVIEPMGASADANGVDWSSFNQNILNSTIFNDVHYAIPLDAHPLIFYYNKKILRDLNLLIDDKPAIEPGPNGFVNFLKKIKEGAPKGVSNLGLNSKGETPYRFWWALYNQLNGPQMIDASGTKVMLNNEQGKKAAEFVNGLFNDGIVRKNQDKSSEEFQAGKVALLLDGVWSTSSFEATKDLEFGAMPVPQIYDKPATWIDSHTFVLPKQKKGEDQNKINAAIVFAKWVTDHAAIWSQAGHIPTTTAAINSDAFKKMPLRQDYLQAASDGKYLPKTPKMWPIKDQLVQALEGIWQGRSSVDQGLDSAVKNMEKLLSR
ncbi:sugar ABC transporter substrate-binding protein [Paenibacillus marchantiophytorum]|uniref:Sugar ABC transporter substrate-binding protein n=1 Tax=Paenibacillus marchantiophytorum TaxID=1619310 RepID=A0ABQ1EQS2_9BACL|nr:ABC transporter substrate-binding protein [Paenibacillus marchantiophytorum]GFZ82913.1 sugar ABC transporter substrate-binding protein [Paenibacillus marchantiophytorum]